jgi:hypothetical protein
MGRVLENDLERVRLGAVCHGVILGMNRSNYPDLYGNDLILKYSVISVIKNVSDKSKLGVTQGRKAHGSFF